MANQAPPENRNSRNSRIALLVALVVGVLYFINTGGMAILLPEQYNVVLTPTPTADEEAAAFAQGSTGGVQDAAAAAPAQEAVVADAPADEPTAAPADEPTVEPTAEPTDEPTAAPTPTATAVATAAPTKAPTAAPTKAPTATAVPAFINGLPTIAWDELPPQAWDTIELIDQGGPFPYDRDGVTFQNREGLLPQERGGFYSEYTVKTPGSSDRGARRIIEGDDGVLYYTDDHYDSFSVVVR